MWRMVLIAARQSAAVLLPMVLHLMASKDEIQKSEYNELVSYLKLEVACFLYSGKFCLIY